MKTTAELSPIFRSAQSIMLRPYGRQVLRSPDAKPSSDVPAGGSQPVIEGPALSVSRDVLRRLVGYKSHINIDSRVWADSAYRSEANKAAIAEAGRRSTVHFRKAEGAADTGAAPSASLAQWWSSGSPTSRTISDV
ncbi:hypothetical protein [Azospirillum sp. TSH7]|uniref:hypothetical protein n=1 Tax=Azospirillum sp. TSH7 TaxID=652751 RepID=UPI001B3BDCAC|nr:hypothetical protein [Azospirillum sp. TSH7]